MVDEPIIDLFVPTCEGIDGLLVERLIFQFPLGCNGDCLAVSVKKGFVDGCSVGIGFEDVADGLCLLELEGFLFTLLVLVVPEEPEKNCSD